MGELVLYAIGDILFYVLGDAFVEWLGWPRLVSSPPPAEGELNASAAAIASIVTLIGALFGGGAAYWLARGSQDPWLSVPFTLGLIFAGAGALLSAWARRVTLRRRSLATLSLWTALITLVVVVLAIVMWAVARVLGV